MPTDKDAEVDMDEPETPEALPTLYVDDDILIVDKPAGLPVHPSSRYLHGTVVGRLRRLYGDKFAASVHRLDRETSGVLVCARHTAAARGLSQSLMAGAWQKTYVAICEGDMLDPQRCVDAALAVGGAVVRIAVRVDPILGKPAVTEFMRIARFERDDARFTWVQAKPSTGRRHQIRAHLRSIGLPIVGDKIYGASEHLYVRFTTGSLDAEDWRRLRLPRQALHALAVQFPHPQSRKTMRFRAPIAVDMLTFASATGSEIAAYGADS